jgi:hypothetical protein
MPSFVRVNPGDPMQAAQLNQVIDALTGAVGKGVPLAPTAVNDATNYALTIQNDDATNSRALLVQKQDGTTLIQADVNGVVLALANGSVHNAALASDVARANLLTNGGFEIWQRGNGPFTVHAAYAADRWQVSLAGTDTLSVSRNTANADTSLGSNACAACTFVLGSGSGGSCLVQALKATDPNQIASRAVSASARVSTGTANAVRIGIHDGTSWTYSSFHTGTGAYQTLTVTATIGSGATAQVGVFFAGSCTAYIDSAMLVVGSQPADYAPLHPADDLARCLRYYEIWGTGGDSSLVVMGIATAGGQFAQNTFPFKASKPVAPTVTIVGTWTVTNAPSIGVANTGLAAVRLSTNSSAAGQFFVHNATAGNVLTIEANA